MRSAWSESLDIIRETPFTAPWRCAINNTRISFNLLGDLMEVSRDVAEDLLRRGMNHIIVVELHAEQIEIAFDSTQVRWGYDADTDRYYRLQNGQIHNTEEADGVEQVSADNIVVFVADYGVNVFDGNPTWNAIPVAGGDLFDFREESTYIQEPPFFVEMAREAAPIEAISGARVLALLGDSDIQELKLEGDDFRLEDGKVRNGDGPGYTYAGIARYRSEFFSDAPDGRFSVVPLLRAAADAGHEKHGGQRALGRDGRCREAEHVELRVPIRLSATNGGSAADIILSMTSPSRNPSSTRAAGDRPQRLATDARRHWLVRELAPGFRLHWRLVAATGATTRSTVDRLRQTPRATFDAAVTSPPDGERPVRYSSLPRRSASDTRPSRINRLTER